MATNPNDPWAQFNPQASSAPAPATTTGPVYGAPAKPKEPKTSYRPLTDDDAAARGLPVDQKYQISSEGDVSPIPGTKIEGGATSKPTEAQQKVGTLLARIAGGFRDVRAVTSRNEEAREPGLIETVRGGLEPEGITGPIARGIAGQDRRMVYDSQRDVLDALLTLSTGAAYTKEQLSGQIASYFPAYGDTQDEIDVKNDRMLRLIEAAKINAGPQWKDIEAAIDPYMQTIAPKPKVNERGFTEEEEAAGLTGTVTDVSDYGGGPGGGIQTSLDRSPKTWMDALAQGTGSVVEGLASIPGMVVDPLATTLGRALGYKDYTSNFGARVREDLGLPENPDRLANAIIGGGSSALAGGGLARGLSTITNPGALQRAFTSLSNTPLRDVAAGAGAGGGGYIGEQIGGVPGAIIGSVAGGVGGYGGANVLARRFLGERAPSRMLQTAEEFGVKVLPAEVGGVRTRMASGAVGRTLGGIPLAEGAEKAVASAGAARGRLAEGLGDVADEAGAGQAARRGFKEFTKGSKERADELYEAVSVAPDSNVQLANTRTALADVTRGMQSNPDLSRLWANHPQLRATLEALTPQDVAPQGREAFIAASNKLMDAQTRYRQVLSAVSSPEEQVAARKAVEAARDEAEAAQKLASTPPQGGELSWQDMNRFRSIVGEIIGQPGISRDGSDIAALRKLYGALSTDMEVTAAQAGPKALEEFRRANKYWRGREKRIDDVFQVLFGSRDQKSDEAVFRQINSWAQGKTGDFSRLARTIRSMPEDEANTIRATVIQRMGQAKPGRRYATEVFSPAEFSTQWNSLSDRAKTVLFPSKKHRQDLDKFAELMSGMKRATEYQNFSNTALGANLTGVGLAGMSGIPGLILAASYSGATFGLGKLLASPRFARIVASTSKLPPEVAARKFGEQLSVIATREPLLAADARGLQQYISEAVGQSPVRAAAGEEEKNRRREPVQ